MLQALPGWPEPQGASWHKQGPAPLSRFLGIPERGGVQCQLELLWSPSQPALHGMPRAPALNGTLCLEGPTHIPGLLSRGLCLLPHPQAEAVRALLAAGADAHACNLAGETALHLAASSNHIAVIRRLLAAGSVASNYAALHRGRADGQTALLCAAVEGHDMAVEELLAAGTRGLSAAAPESTRVLRLEASDSLCYAVP